MVVHHNLGSSICKMFLTNFRISSCSGTVTENCTYIQNPGYSSSYTTSGSCSFSVTPLNSDICQMRLDFDTFTTTIATDGVCTDSFIVTSPGTANSLPTLCGTLKNQHCKFSLSLKNNFI